jgi:hypothetical protein
MKNCQNRKCVSFGREVNIVFVETAQTNSPGSFANFWKPFGLGLCPLQGPFKIRDKLVTKSRSLPFVPSSSLCKLQSRFALKNDPETHFRPKRSLSSAFTCSQGMPSCGLASKSARRRSSSAICSGLKSGSNPSSIIISQKSCANLIRSSFGRALAASRISRALMCEMLAPSAAFSNPAACVDFPL